MIDEKKLANAAMSEEELDNVVGGGTRQCIGDADFLESRDYLMNCSKDFVFDWGNASKALDSSWAAVGVTCVTKFGCPDNLYFIGGKQVSRKDAFRHALRRTGCTEDYVRNYDFDQWAGSFD